MWLRAICLATVLTPMLGACATAPKACTSEWVDYKTDGILRSFALDNRGLLKDLRKLQDADGDLNPIVTIRLMSNTKRLSRFADSFTDIVVPELEAAFQECGASDQLVPALTDFLRDEGVGDDALEWVGPIMDLVQDLRKDDAATPLSR